MLNVQIVVLPNVIPGMNDLPLSHAETDMSPILVLTLQWARAFIKHKGPARRGMRDVGARAILVR